MYSVMEQCTILWMLVGLLLAHQVLPFNIESNAKTAKFVFSPVVSLKNVSEENERMSSMAKVSYFGYDFTLQRKDNNSSRLVVGSPKLINPDNLTLQSSDTSYTEYTRGGIYAYDVRKPLAVDEDLTFSSIYPPNPRESDNFGLALSNRPDGNSFTCSPTRELDCGTVKTSPGFCYKSTDFGKTWSATKHTKEIECPTRANVDVLFVLDGSGSVGQANFLKVKNWVKTISREIGIDEGNVSVGVVQYSYYEPSVDINEQRWIKTEIKIGSKKTYEEFAKAVDKITLHTWQTWTGQALRKVMTDFKEAIHYYKQTTKQVMILLTDGRADDPEDVSVNAKKLRDLGVIPYAVGVGSVKEQELRIIANGDSNDDTRVYKVDNFEALDEIAKELKTEITGLVLEGGKQDNDASNALNFGEMGLAMAYSKGYPSEPADGVNSAKAMVRPEVKHRA